MFDLITKRTNSAKDDLLSGLTVALALVPEAIAFAFVAGVEPLVGLYAAFIVGLVTSIAGGRPGMISGATGATAVAMVVLVGKHGAEYLFATVALTGVIQILCGILRLGRFIRLIPHSVMLGFVNGLAIVILLSQFTSFKVENELGEKVWMSGITLWITVGLAFATMAIIHFLPRLTKAVPSTLAAIIVISFAVIGLGINTPTVGDLASIKGGLPTFHIPAVPFTWETFGIILPTACILAAIGLIESLMTLNLIDEITETRGKGNRECVGQGLANLTCGFFSAMGGCAMIGQSMINIKSGGRGRLSGITAAVCLLCFILFASPLIEQIPIAALTGVMFMVVIGTFEWSTFRVVRQIPLSDAFVIIAVAGITVATDNLALAVFVGVIIAALVFAWENARHIRIEVKKSEEGYKEYDLHGPLFFGSTTHFQDIFTPNEDPEHVVVDFIHSRVWDHSGLEAINSLAERYQKAGKKLHLRHLSPECRKLLTKAGSMVEVNVVEDPYYNVANIGNK
ncbi:MAG: SulP family inorganic anion transporter [Verrucomicrobiota bacterium]